MANKIKYGLKNVYYAVATIAADGSATYAAPKAFPGAVSLSLEPQGEAEPFYADNIVYWVGTPNNGYEGDLEMAMIIDDFKKDVLGYVTDQNGVLVEKIANSATHFALLFQFEGDVEATRHVLYNCTATRATAGGQTKGENIEPQTETVTINASSIYVAALSGDIVKAECKKSTSQTQYNAWTSSVYIATTQSTT